MKKKGEEGSIHNEKNIIKLLPSRLLDFLLSHIEGNQQNSLEKSLRNACEKVVYNKVQVSAYKCNKT